MPGVMQFKGKLEVFRRAMPIQMTSSSPQCVIPVCLFSDKEGEDETVRY